MIKTARYKLSQQANRVIKTSLYQRIPFFREFRFDDDPTHISQVDLFGNVDTLITLGSTRVYQNQNKSRIDNRKDVCVECRSYRGKTINPDNNTVLPVAGAHWYEPGKCWLAPRWGMIDTLTVYLPGPGFVGHFNRYYLDIMFSSPEIWESMTGLHKNYNDSDTFIVFFNYKIFCEIYLRTVTKVTCGDKNIYEIVKCTSRHVL